LVQVLPWDFRTAFPEPTEQALDAGIISDEDNQPDAIRSIHEEHTRELLAVLKAMEAVSEARRRGIDPITGKPPGMHGKREKLRRWFQEEPERLERSFTNLIGVYEDAFGQEAAEALTKAVRAWNAGIDVVSEGVASATVAPAVSTRIAPPAHKRSSTRLPVPHPLPAAVNAGRFGLDDHGKPVRPGPDEVRAITENHAEKLIGLLESRQELAFRTGIEAYAEDFGDQAAHQLERHVIRQLQPPSRSR
jgi:hypothetical protein